MAIHRLVALAIGIVCSCLGMYGAFEFAMKLEGGAVTYLVLAAPVIAGVAAQHSRFRRGNLERTGLHQGPPVVGRSGPCWSRGLFQCR